MGVIPDGNTAPRVDNLSGVLFVSALGQSDILSLHCLYRQIELLVGRASAKSNTPKALWFWQQRNLLRP